MENNNFNLVIEIKERSPMPIELGRIENSFDGSIESIDGITSKYTADELYEFLTSEENNMIHEDYLGGTFSIIKGKRNRVAVKYADTYLDFDLDNFIMSNLDDKNVMNVFYNKLQQLVKNIETFNNIPLKDYFDNKELRMILVFIYILPYETRRALEFYTIRNILKEKSIQRVNTAI